jgi:hypothetical protein
VIRITPEAPVEGDALTCEIVTPSFDADGDTLTYTYAWEVDGAATAFATDEVPAGETVAGEEWTCRATGTDRSGPEAESVYEVVVSVSDHDGDGFADAADCDPTDSAAFDQNGATSSCAANSCRDIQAKGYSVGDGLYWVALRDSVTLQVRCDMSRRGGGWTLIARGVSQDYAGWSTSGSLSQPDEVSRTFKMSDIAINGLTGTVLWMEPYNSTITTSWFWDMTLCVYNHTGMATGACNRAFLDDALTLPTGPVGIDNADHFGVGDWSKPNGREWLHTNTHNDWANGQWWTRQTASSNSAFCHASDPGCNILLWVK